MLRRLRQRRSLWAALAAGLVAMPALFGGVAAAPADAHDMLPPPDLDPRETPPPSPAEMEARLVLAMADSIADLVPEEYRMATIMAARRYAVDPRLLAAVVTVETEWRPNVVGMYGERGLMQVLPSTGKWLAEEAGMTTYDLADPATSLTLGALYLSMLLKEHGTVQKALAVYNGGPAAIEYAERSIYARKVMKWLQRSNPAHRPGVFEHAA